MKSTCDFVGFVMLWLKLFHSGVGDKVSLLSMSAVTAFHKP